MRYLKILATLLLIASTSHAADPPKRVLLVTHAGGYMHDSILIAEQILGELGRNNGYKLTCYRFTADPDKKITVKREVERNKAQGNPAGAVILVYDIKKLPGTQANGHLAADVAEVLKRRVDPYGVANIIWRPQGDEKLEIQISAVDNATALKRLLKGAGVLEFHILANGTMPVAEYELYAKRLKEDGPRVHAGDVARWFEVPPEIQVQRTETHLNKQYMLGYIAATDGQPRCLDAHNGKPWHLTDARRGTSAVTGERLVNFSFDPQGAMSFGELTEANINHPLAIILDNKVISAPVIRSKITAQASITGGGHGLTEEELNYLVYTLNAGSLPAALSDEPISERTVAAAVEAETTALEDYSARYQKLMGAPVTLENCGHVNSQTLKNFDAVIFFTTSTWKKDSGSHPLTPDELKDLIEWVNQGGAFVAVHCGSDTLHDTAYGDLVGGTFGGHPWLQTVRLHVEDPNHPAGKAFAEGAEIMDEIYQFGKVSDRPKVPPMSIQPYSREKLHIITSIDPTSIDLSIGARPDHDYASSWCHLVGKGRSFYTALGHHKSVWLDPRFQQHLLGGLKWALGELPGDATPSAELKK